MKGQLGLPCAMLLGHPTNAGGSLTHPAWCTTVGACPCRHSLRQSCRERSLLGSTEKEEADSCHWETAANWQQQPNWGTTRVKLGGSASALSSPDPWYLRRGPVGRRSIHGCHGLIQQAAKHNTAAGSLPPPVRWGRELGGKSKIHELTVL